MTSEEIQRTIEGMLAVQRELQNSQLKLQEESQQQRQEIKEMASVQKGMVSIQKEMLSIQRDLQEGQMQMLDAVSRLIGVSNRHERRIEQLIGYSITGESDRLDLLQRIMTLESKVRKLENGQES